MVFHGIIYKFTDLTNGKIYVGQTTRLLNKRFKEHIREAGKIKCMPLLNTIHRHCKENFR